MAKGIRSYGPGKFATVLDSYAYEMTLDGGADEEATYPQEGSGWYGVVWFEPGTRERVREIAEEEGDRLTEEEEDLLDETKAVILFERSDGIVEVEWYDNLKEAEEAWANVLVDTEGEEEDEEDEDEEDEEEAD